MLHRPLHRLIRLIKSELEVALALLILLTCAVGFSFANETQVDSAAQLQEVAADTVEPTDKLYIDGISYRGLIFGNKLSSYYQVKTVTGGPLYVTDQGLTAIDPNRQYSFSLTLDRPLNDAPWYLDFQSKSGVKINGQAINLSTAAITLTGATTLTFQFSGDTTLTSLTHTKPNAITDTSVVKNLYLAPNDTNVVVGSSRSFLLVALDETGATVDVADRVTWSTSNPAIATINSTTGLLQGLAVGTIQITAQVDEAIATATVTVRPQTEFLIPTTQPSTTSPTTPTEPTDSPAEPAPSPDTSDIDLFEDAAILDRLAATGSTRPTQAEIEAIEQTLPSLTDRIVFRITSAFDEIRHSVIEMIYGSTITNPETGETISTPSALQVIGNFLRSLFD